MLFSLHIENIAVIKNVDIDFSQGFMALTGETGAGKSIIIDSINLLLGKKAERELIRSGETSAMVSGLFGNLRESALKALSECGISPDEEGNVLVQRTVNEDGRSQIKINGRSVSLAILKGVTSSLVTIHGQTDTLALTDAEKQLELLDLYAENRDLLLEYSEKYKALTEIRAEIKDLSDKESERERLIEILEYQISDIDSFSLKDGEEEALIDKKLKIKNSEKISKNAGFVFKALKGSEKGSASFLIDRSISALEQISDVVPGLSEYSEKLRDVLYLINDISEEVYSVIADMEDDPEERQKDFYIDMASSTLNIFPIASDFVDKFVFGYDMSLSVFDVANDTLDALKSTYDVANRAMKGEHVSSDEIYKTSTSFVTRFFSFVGVPVEPAERTVTGLIRRFSPSTVYGWDSMKYGSNYSAEIQAAIESGDDALAEAVLEQLYKDEATGSYTERELEEIIRLYSLTDEEGKHYDVLPRRVGATVNEVKLNAAQRKQFDSIYSQATEKVNGLIDSETYAGLDDKARAKAIKSVYSLYYDLAAAEVTGKELSANAAISYLTGDVTTVLATKAYKSGLEEYKDARGNTVTVKEQFAAYVKGLNLSHEEQVVVSYANGYRGKATKNAVIKQINGMGLSAAQLEAIAKALGLEVKNGVVVAKDDE